MNDLIVKGEMMFRSFSHLHIFKLSNYFLFARHSFSIHCSTYNTAGITCAFTAGIKIFYLRMMQQMSHLSECALVMKCGILLQQQLLHW